MTASYHNIGRIYLTIRSRGEVIFDDCHTMSKIERLLVEISSQTRFAQELSWLPGFDQAVTPGL